MGASSSEMKKFLSFFFIFIITLIVTGAFLIYLRRDVGETGSQGLASQSLSSAEYEDIHHELINLLQEMDPKNALEKLSRDIKNNDALARSCHILAHEIGREAFKKYQDFGTVIRYQNEICNSGYLHGVIESYFLRRENLFDSLGTVCSDYPEGKFLSWQCYHGIGHGLMYYTTNDLPKSLAMCGNLPSKFGNLSCANGVFMENFNTDQKLHPSKYLKDNDLFYPCEEQHERHKGDCYLYAPTYFLSVYPGQYSQALVWCQDAEGPYGISCAEGVGMQVMKENINNPKFAEAVCAEWKLSVSYCLSGMVGLYINHHGSLDAGRKLCAEMSFLNRFACVSALHTRSSLFEN